MSGPLSVAVLAGGESSRMGANKALMTIGGRSLIERVLDRVAGLGDEVMVIANQPEPYAPLGLPIYPDVLPGNGPLGGLYTAISHSAGDHTLVVSCDQPFLNRDLLDYLIGLRAGYDVVVPLNRDGYPQSMYAVYGRGCLGAIRQRLDADRLKVIGFYRDVRVREVTPEEIDRFDPERLSFINVNTPDELARARRLAAEQPEL